MSTTCANCTAATADGIALCERCLRTARHALTNTAAYYADLDRVPTGGGPRRRGSTTPDPTGVRAAAIMRDPVAVADQRATNALTTWARVLVADRPQAGAPPVTVPDLAPWLARHLNSVATLEWAAEFLREMLATERLLKRVAERARTGSYLGLCGLVTREEAIHDGCVCGCGCHALQTFAGRPLLECDVEGGCSPEIAVLPPERCERPLYAGNDQRFVTCRCGATWDVRARRQQLVRAAEDELAPVAVIARLAAVFASEPSVGRLETRIRKWVQREAVRPVTTKVIDGRPRKVYRVGDVLDLLAADTPRKRTG